MTGGELPPPEGMEVDPTKPHKHGYRWDLNDWWCFDCDTVTDFCSYLNDQDPEPIPPTEWPDEYNGVMPEDWPQ